MAILQDIRNRAGIFIMIFVGVALFLFVIDPEVFTFLFEKQETRIARINRNNVEYEEFLELSHNHEQFLRIAHRSSSIDSETMEAVREQAWNEILREYIINPYIDQVGLNVSDPELDDLLFGANIHSIIHQNFTNQQTGRLDTIGVRNFFARADEDFESYTIAEYFKNMIVQDRLLNKYNTMIAKGFYTPVLLAKKDYHEKNTNVNFEYVVRKFRDIPDKDITVSESDIKEYYNNNLFRFQVEEDNRDIEYVLFDVIPSTKDSLRAQEIMEDYYEDFVIDEDPVSFAARFTDFPTQDIYYKKEELPAGIEEEFFYEEIGTSTGIVLKDGIYFAAIIVDEVERPDSVNASHILISPDETRNIETCRTIADSLMLRIEDGEDFMMLAMQYSDDPGSQQQGGELGWFTDGMMVPEFNEACFTGEPGDIVIVETRFGIHIIKINEQTEAHKKIKLAVLQKEITFSEDTYNAVYSKASTFSANSETGEEFDKNVVKNNYIKRIASNLGELDKSIPGIENPREIIMWAHEENRNTNDVSHVFVVGSKFVVAKVTAIREKGNAPLEDVRMEIEPIVLKNKKAEILKAELSKDIAAGMDINAIASKYKAESDFVQTINFHSFSIPGLGIEPNLVAAATSVSKNQISQPIVGNNGVFVINVTDVMKAPGKSDFSAEQLNLMRTHAARVGFRTIEALQKRADIEDFRSRWF